MKLFGTEVGGYPYALPKSFFFADIFNFLNGRHPIFSLVDTIVMRIICASIKSGFVERSIKIAISVFFKLDVDLTDLYMYVYICTRSLVCGVVFGDKDEFDFLALLRSYYSLQFNNSFVSLKFWKDFLSVCRTC